MPEKDTGFWLSLLLWAKINLPFALGGIMAGITGTFREKRDGSSWLRSLSEGFMCGCFAIAFISAFEVVGLHEKLAQLFGCAIGFMGTKKISTWIEELFNYFKVRFFGKKL